ncbi:MAG TPA: PqqD family protein [Candidatus Acidoferrum sp.]|nr:PqqD family protein [Candidatus Acidoferrum sp.]
MAASRELGGEMIIMSAVDSTLFTLNDVASLIWKSADGATSLQEIVESKVCAEFDVDPSVAFADAERLVGELAKRGLLLVADHPVEQSLHAERNS